MAIKENSNMRLIHKSKLSNRLLILCVADIIVVLWIMWNEGRIQYEPLLDYNLAADTKTLPLDSGTYNTTVLTIVSNIIVLIIEIKKKYTKIRDKYYLPILVLYVFVVIGCLSSGYIHISSRMEEGVINEYNSLFRLPIMLFGKNAFTNIVTVMNLYVALCFIQICTCIIYVIKVCRVRRIN